MVVPVSFLLILVYFIENLGSLQSLEIIPFGSPLSRLPENSSPPTRTDRNRYRHNFAINPIIRNAGNNQTFAPVIWDLAPNSYPIDFLLYTKDNPYLAEELTINNATDSKYFDGEKQTKVIIHDFMQSSENTLIHDVKDAYMSRKESYNVLLVDWEPARKYSYTVAVTVSEYVGKMTGRLVQALKVNPTKMHVIGFGLGAHAAGVMGNDLKIHTNMTLARITGLDPSLPLFRMAGNYFKLDREDASFVDVIHTDGGDNLWNSNHLGSSKESGHIDIYPNRGIFQPGCRQSSLPNYNALQCSHTRALEIYKESILDEMSFVACRCPDWDNFFLSRCNCMHDANRILVGEACSSSAIKGKYFLITLDGPPYGMGGKGVVPDLTRSTDPGIAMNNLFAVNGSFIQGINQIASIFTAPIKPFLNSLVRNAQTAAAVDNSINNNNGDDDRDEHLANNQLAFGINGDMQNFQHSVLLNNNVPPVPMNDIYQGMQFSHHYPIYYHYH